MKQVYRYDPITFEYLGLDYAQESPLEKGVFLMPANTTELAPPDIPEGKYAKFELDQENYSRGDDDDEGKVDLREWKIKEDIRGVWYTSFSNTVICESLLDEIPPEWSRTPLEKTIEEKRQSVLREINTFERKIGVARPIREWYLSSVAPSTVGYDAVKSVDAQIKALRIKLKSIK